jgi:gluconate 2-dehydrogenase gamma chain
MANQSPDRRQVLEMLARVAAVAQFPGFARWAYADQTHQHGEQKETEVKPEKYTPQFFDASQYATIDRVTNLIIPADDTPGAHDAGVAEFVDFMAAGDPQIQEPFRTGLNWLDAAANAKHGDVFIKLTEAQQVGLLQSAASAGHDTPDGKFFRLVREYTVMGYYTSRIGLKALDYPGLKLYAQSPACPHHGNPEHKNLSA